MLLISARTWLNIFNMCPTKKTKGLVAGHSMLISTGESLGKKITYQSGNGSPVILNFCPFCGGKLHSINDEG